MTRFRGPVRVTLGPLPCIACGRLVVWGVREQTFVRGWDGLIEPVRRRDLYDASTDAPHECRSARASAA